MAGKRGGLHGYTVQEAQNSSMGQVGSVYTVASSDAIKPPTGAVFVAISIITDCTFDASAGLVAEDENLYINTAQAAHDTGSGSEGISRKSGRLGSGGQVVDSVIFPAGLTIYGRWTEIDVASGSCIAYIG